MNELKKDHHRIALMKNNNNTRNEISAKKDSNLDDGKNRQTKRMKIIKI